MPVSTTGRLSIPGAAEAWLARAAHEAAEVAAGARVISGITYAQFCDAYEAFSYANARGLIMDTRVDVTWSSMGLLTEVDILAAHRSFIDLLAARFQQAGMPFACVAVFEVGATRGLHTHYTMHVPQSYYATAFEELCETTLICAVGRKLTKSDGNRTMNVDLGSSSIVSQWQRFRYVMKGVSPNAALPRQAGVNGTVPLHTFAGLDPHFRFQGFIPFARVEVSDTLSSGRRAQQRQACPEMPDMSVRTDGPQLYSPRCFEWYQAMRGNPIFGGTLRHET